MAAAVQKNGMKPLSNGNSLVATHEVQDIELSGYQVDQVYGGTPDVYSSSNVTQCKDLAAQDVTLDGDVPTSEAAPKIETSQCEEPEIDIVINNVVCSFSLRCHLNLREIALHGINVEYRRENGMITMKLRRPYTTASIWSSGKVTCTGATSELQAKIAARRFARLLQKLGFNVRFNNYRVVNVLGTCCMPFAIKINLFSERHKEADYEPELHPGVTYKLKNPKATLKIFSTGSVTVTAPSVADVQAAIEYIYPLVYEFRKERSAEDMAAIQASKKRRLWGGTEEVIQDPVYVKEEEEESEGDEGANQTDTATD
ncbi:TATA box-binding protein-like protein 1 [Agrilus planipennis]|uniref:TATA box-binding protein-like 1 n=1 Tax=Agrilus planipennis TaxID=224129 RepID=A0A7F5RAM3_AGRPL|nr:TATA box-binding protein-like protein 1 [Agrilus planipennis]XP_025833008.1 TATA box-binding protein-like protein 1 [Agrilus planipennis]XP_025833009.1 TATA box-binding protein-like protein 1 [Agrilus planipennis]